MRSISDTGAVTPLPSDEQKACQSPKPILLNTVCLQIRPDRSSAVLIICILLPFCFQGFAHTPYDWSPSTVDVQMLRMGNFGWSLPIKLEKAKS
jgi:neutral ceramidase